MNNKCLSVIIAKTINPIWTFALTICISLTYLTGAAPGATPEHTLTYNSRPGTVITNDPIRSYGLNESELEIIKDKGLLITERVSYTSFGEAYYDIYRRDLPVYLTADSILHAVHRSFDHIVMELETEELNPRLEIVLDAVLKTLSDKENHTPEDNELWVRMLVARSILEENLDDKIDRFGGAIDKTTGGEKRKADQDASDTTSALLSLPWMTTVAAPVVIEVESRFNLLQEYQLDEKRNRDYSMCRPRGHYTKTEALKAYFSALVYLGIDPFIAWSDKRDIKNSGVDLKSQLRSALEMAHAIRDDSKAMQAYQEMEQLTSAIFGKPNAITILELLKIEKEMSEAGKSGEDDWLSEIQALVDSSRKNGIRFHVSPISTAGPPDGPPAKPPACISLCPRRQSFDAYIMQSVVNQSVRDRWMATHLDVALVMGSSKAEELLQEDCSKHPGLTEKYAELKSQYTKEAVHMRNHSSGIAQEWYLAMGELFREKRFAKKDHLKALTSPAFETRRLHTFMGTYTEYKHDMVAYSTQANLGGTFCEFPHVFIDPYPELYRRLANFSAAMAGILQDNCLDTKREFYLDCTVTFTQLTKIAEKEIEGTPFTEEEKVFLKNLIDIHWPFGSGSVTYSGWYSQLFPEEDPTTSDMIVADIFSTPKEYVPKNFRDKVLHIGTGPINLGFFELPGPDEKPMIYVGPVYSVYETLTSSRKRLTDKTWKRTLLEKDPENKYRWLKCADQKKLLTQPLWLEEILLKTNSLEMVHLNEGIPSHLSFPLNLKFTQGAHIVKEITEASTLKDVYYLKPSHSIIINPGGLADKKKLENFICQAEKDQCYMGRDEEKIFMRKVTELKSADRWKYWSAQPDLFSDQLFETILKGSADQQIMGFLSLQGSKHDWHSQDIGELNKHILNNMPSNVIGAAKGFYAKNVVPDKKVAPVLKKLGLWPKRDPGELWIGDEYHWDEDMPFDKSIRIMMLTDSGYQGLYRDTVYPCRIPRISLDEAKIIDTASALAYLEQHSGFQNWRFNSVKNEFIAERTCFWKAEETGMPYEYGKMFRFKREMLLNLVPFENLKENKKLTLSLEYIPLQQQAVIRYLNAYIQKPTTNGSAQAVNHLIFKSPDEIEINKARFKQITSETLNQMVHLDDIGYAALNAQLMKWEDLDVAVLHAFLSSDNPDYELIKVVSNKCKRDNIYHSNKPAIIPEACLEFFTSNTNNSLIRLKQIVKREDTKWNGSALSLAEAIYEALQKKGVITEEKK